MRGGRIKFERSGAMDEGFSPFQDFQLTDGQMHAAWTDMVGTVWSSDVSPFDITDGLMPSIPFSTFSSSFEGPWTEFSDFSPNNLLESLFTPKSRPRCIEIDGDNDRIVGRLVRPQNCQGCVFKRPRMSYHNSSPCLLDQSQYDLDLNLPSPKPTRTSHNRSSRHKN